MYKKCITLFALMNVAILTAWLSVQGLFIDRQAATAFQLMGMSGEQALQVTSYLGIMREQSSSERILNTNLVTRRSVYEITQEEYENLLRIVEAEAGGEDKTGKMLVANVILNRVESEQFPDTISEVIFQTDGGITQFSPISDGRFYTVKVSGETVEAVNEVLSGADNSQGALYFAARKAAGEGKMRWFDTHLTRLFAYGGHEFFS